MADILYINDKLVDLPENSIALTLQNNDVAEVRDRQTNYSNNIKLPKTPKNILTMEMLGVTGNTTRLQYKQVRIKYISNGFELISNGVGIIKNTNNFYNLIIYDGNIELSTILTDLKLTDLDWSVYNHNLNIDIWKDSMNNTSGYIYAYGNYTGLYTNILNVILVDLQIPSFFIHTLFSMIFEQKGFTITGDIFSDAEYLSDLITTNIGYDRTIVSNEIIIDFRLLFGDTTQISFVKEIMQRYGLLYRKIKNTNEFEFKKFDDLLTDFDDAEDWSNKYVDDTDEKYKPNYAQNNYFLYKYDEQISVTGFADGNIQVSNINLPIEKTLITSIFKATETEVIAGQVFNASNYWELKDGDFTPRTDGLRIFRTLNRTSTYLCDFQPDLIGSRVLSLDLKQFNFDETKLNYSELIKNNYADFSDMLNDYKSVMLELNLSILDIFNLNFFKLKYFEQLGKYYYLNKVINFQKNKKTKVEAIESPVTGIQTAIFPEFNTQLIGYETSFLACSNLTGTAVRFHNGNGNFPVIGDTVFSTDIGGLFDGNDLFYKLGFEGQILIISVIQINSSGVVTAATTCI